MTASWKGVEYGMEAAALNFVEQGDQVMEVMLPIISNTRRHLNLN